MKSNLTEEQTRIVLDWADDLLSGNRRQGTSRLAIRHGGHVEFCCLGVLSDRAERAGVVRCHQKGTGVLAYGTDRAETDLPEEVMEWSGLDDPNPILVVPERLRYKLSIDGPYKGNGQISAISLNDEYGFTFAEIGECIKHTYGEESA